MRGWEDRALPSTTSDTEEARGPQDGAPEAHPGSPRAFHFHFSLLNIGVTSDSTSGHCPQVCAQIHAEGSPGAQDTTTSIPTCWGSRRPR